jgi:hypothetical protein
MGRFDDALVTGSVDPAMIVDPRTARGSRGGTKSEPAVVDP